MSSAPALSAEDRAWLNQWNASFGAISKKDLGVRGSRADALGKVLASFKLTPQYGTQASLAGDLMAYHRNRLVGTVAFQNDPGGTMAAALAAQADEVKQRLDEAMAEPPE